MKHKNILLVAFVLSLFVFQQVQAGAITPFAKNPLQTNPDLANAGILYPNLYVYIYQLIPPPQNNPGAIMNCTPYRFPTLRRMVSLLPMQ
jgi:hypothetical protein